MTNCNNCNSVITYEYCPKCGHPAKLKRIDRHYIVHEIEHVLHFEKGILFTIRELLTKPGENVRNYITKNRSRLIKPIIFIVITSLIYSLTNHFFHIEDGYVKITEVEKTVTGKFFNWISSNYGYSNIIMGTFIAFWIKIFFKKYDYNFYEILILLCFVMGMGMLIFAIFALFQGITKLESMQIGSVVAFVYSSWAIGQFFDKSKRSNYVKALLAYLLGFFSFSATAVLIGITIDYLMK